MVGDAVVAHIVVVRSERVVAGVKEEPARASARERASQCGARADSGFWVAACAHGWIGGGQDFSCDGVVWPYVQLASMALGRLPVRVQAPKELVEATKRTAGLRRMIAGAKCEPAVSPEPERR